MENAQTTQPTWHPLLDGYEGSVIGLRDDEACLVIVYESMEQAQAAQQWLAGDIQ